ncbi:MAG TPA: hypothetical protein VIV60_09045 [Polyangiaceae bacterium]
MRLRLVWIGFGSIGLALACARRASDTDAQLAAAGAGGLGTVQRDAGPEDAAIPRDRDLKDVAFNYENPEEDASLSADAACAATSVPAQPLTIDMVLLLDRSATMRQPLDSVPSCNVGDSTASRWCYAINALGGFFSAPTSNGMGVALEFFPPGNCGWVKYPTEQNCCTFGDCCQGANEADPQVPMGELPAHLPDLVAALNAQDPLGTTTPLEGALRGITAYAAQAKRPERQMVSVITTDGNPNGCERDANKLAAILKQHRDATGQLTFVIGMTGANYPVLETLAQAGGAALHTAHCAGDISPCSFYDVSDGTPSAFIDALQQIQRSVVGCRFGMPSTDGGLVDAKSMVVEWKANGRTSATRLVRQSNSGDCGEGWYPDADHPGQFALCPSTCSFLQAQALVSVNVLIDCLGS